MYQFLVDLTHGEDLLFYLSIAHSGIYKYTHQTIYRYRRGNLSAMTDLRKLEKGYLKIYEELAKSSQFTVSDLKQFYRKVKMIMFKSYLGNRQPINALKSLLNY